MGSLKVFAQSPLSKASWITPAVETDTVNRPCPVFRKKFTATKKIYKASLYLTAHGLYEATINGKRVGKAYFTPGWTAYEKRLQYQLYDVKGLLSKNNTIEVTVAEGWWRGVFGGDLKRNQYGNDASLLCQLEIIYADGSKQSIVSDTSWHTSTGSILHTGFYDGEWQDKRKQSVAWTKAAETSYSKDKLVSTIGEPVTKQERFKPVSIKGSIIDFGQNMAGWVQLKIKGKAGDTIKVFHGEMLDAAGNLFTGNLRDAKALDVYILKSGETEILEPHFTYHGFRYAKLEGFKPTRENCLAIAVHSNLKHTGTFACSDPIINQLQHNIEWSLNSNFFDIPTDCPQRSERLGWTGDAQIFCRTACFNRDVRTFFKKWLIDLSAEQGANGVVPVTVPRLDRNNTRGVAGWGDAATIVPSTLYEVYGDISILKDQYASMKSWVDYIVSVSPNYLWKANGYGDWYAPGDSTSLPLIDQCFFAYSTQLLINAAAILQQHADSAFYSEQLKKIKTAFLKEYSRDIVNTQTQTAYVLALQFDMLPEPERQAVAAKLAALIHQNNDHLATGFLGTPYLLHVLSRFGYTDLSFTLLNQKTAPSWLFPITKGATTIWEKWEAIKPDGSFDTCSLNHYAYGAVGDWLYRVVAGIDVLLPAYKKIKIEPHIGGGLKWVKAKYKGIVSQWKIIGTKVFMHVVIPKGSSAIVYVPGSRLKKVLAGSYDFIGHLN